MEALLIGAWCANSPGDKFDADCSNTETVMRLVSMTLHEVRAMQALGVEVLNVDCGARRPKTSKPLCHPPQPRSQCRGFPLRKFEAPLPL